MFWTVQTITKTILKLAPIFLILETIEKILIDSKSG